MPSWPAVDFGPLLLSLEVATCAAVVATGLGLVAAALLASGRFPGRDVVDVLFAAPLVLPPTVLGYYLLVALGRRSVVGQAFEGAFGHPIVFTRLGAVIAATVGAFPLVVRTARAALEDVDPAFVRAARTLGASRLRALYAIEIPLARRGLFAAAALAFARALGDFGLTLMVAGDIPGETRTSALAIYGALQAGRDSEAARLSIVHTAVVLLVLYVIVKAGARRART